MKILIPTAKEMKIPNKSYPFVELGNTSKNIVDKLSIKSTDELMSMYKIKESQALIEKDRIFQINNKKALTYNAIDLFNGLMYRNIDRENFSEDDLYYMKSNVFITSSLYGIINVYDKISEHRLDFLQRLDIDGLSLKNIWQPYYDEFIKNDELVISLLSSEFEEVFSKDMRNKMIKINFVEKIQNEYKTHSTISKKARGKFLNELIKNKVYNINQIKNITFDNYIFNEELSSERKIVFVKLKGE
ncbi:peroxide stress protein YaaA [Gemelliphila palaticanis]|uniref:UPF0246 protein HZY85_06610 n=1 Tax=Gemelliphila palaticanis TaxID=81950 RepID=A0ABX2T0F3_9BACL|nr:peroxide stress protein YaaA [Gemella palaticanis]MBF0715927.1 peroxide stress protein YaaA [Gemella palaticanis]NYS47857.1 peroxide stress protein YaaA [Gemella palaticanis]